MEKIMTQEEYIDYLKKKAKALDMDYIESLERGAYLRYQIRMLEHNKKLLTEGE